MNKNLIITTSHPVTKAMELFAGRTTAMIAGISIEMTGAEPLIRAGILSEDGLKTDKPVNAKLERGSRDIMLGGIYQVGNIVFVTGERRLAEYVGQNDVLAALTEGFQVLTDRNGKRADSLLLWGPNEITLAFIGGRWINLEDVASSYGYHVFGVNPSTREVYAFRSLQGKKNAIVAATYENGRLKWRVLHEAKDGFFDSVSKIVQTQEGGFIAHVTTTNDLTMPMTITRVGKVEFDRPIKWAGRILAPWFDQGAKQGAWPVGLFTAMDNTLVFTPTREVKDETVRRYMEHAAS